MSLADVAQDLLRELGPKVVVEVFKAIADAATTGTPPNLSGVLDLGTARKVRDIIPDPLPNDALDDKIDAEIAKRQRPTKGILANTPNGADED